MKGSMKEIPKNYRSITYCEFSKQGKINSENFSKLKEICIKYNAIIDEKKKEIWFGGLGEKTKEFFTELDRLVGNKNETFT